MSRYIVESPQEWQGRENVGTYYEQYGWRVRDTQPPTPETGGVVMSGSKSEARRWARELNAR